MAATCQQGHKADVDRADKDGFTPLFTASENGYADVVELLLAKGADVNKAALDGQSPLFVAAEAGHGEMVARLLAAGADRSAATTELYTAVPAGSTALSVAELKGHAAVAALLR